MVTVDKVAWFVVGRAIVRLGYLERVLLDLCVWYRERTYIATDGFRDLYLVLVFMMMMMMRMVVGSVARVARQDLPFLLVSRSC